MYIHNFTVYNTIQLDDTSSVSITKAVKIHLSIEKARCFLDLIKYVIYPILTINLLYYQTYKGSFTLR